jgi:hypothetical protein
VRAASPVAAAIAKQTIAVVAAVSTILGMGSLPLVRLISVEMRVASPVCRHASQPAICCAGGELRITLFAFRTEPAASASSTNKHGQPGPAPAEPQCLAPVSKAQRTQKRIAALSPPFRGLGSHSPSSARMNAYLPSSEVPVPSTSSHGKRSLLLLDSNVRLVGAAKHVYKAFGADSRCGVIR